MTAVEVLLAGRIACRSSGMMQNSKLQAVGGIGIVEASRATAAAAQPEIVSDLLVGT